jgi:alanine dehydrogenase
MNVGIPRERRPFEFRVGLTPAGAEILCQHGHTVFVEHKAGNGAGFPDKEYEQAGANIVYSPEEAYGRAGLVLKIARPTEEELPFIQPGTTLAGLLNLPSARQSKIEYFLKNNITAVAYEQICEADGSLPVLRPSSQIGGAMTVEIAARLLHSDQGGGGILLGGIPGVPPAEVVILGAGTAGTYAARAFAGLGAHVTVLDKDVNALQRISLYGMNLVTMLSTERNIVRCCGFANVLVCAALVPWTRAPLLVTRETVRKMKPRSVIIDMSIDEGGCVETSRPTSHDRPTYVEEGIIHYCVPNMPAIVARTAMHGFVNVATPYILQIADMGVEKAMQANPAIEAAVNTHQGQARHLPRWNV